MLNETLDIPALAARYAPRQRIQIRDVLDAQAAADLHGVLTRGTPWQLIYHAGGTKGRLTPEQMASMPPQDRAALINRVYEQSLKSFGYLYNANTMTENYERGDNPGHPLHRVFEFMNGPRMLDLIRGVTGIASVRRVTAQATLYLPGHFLNTHDDHINGHGRRVAYVLGMARDWNPDWGGLLQFHDAQRDVEETIVPRFNALSLFGVPQSHAVSVVAPRAPAGRLAITGWFHD